ncbi:MAG: thiolase family protein [Geminicoccales bacterium]
MPSTVIFGAARTPMGGFQGSLSAKSATEMGGIAIKGALDGAGIQPDSVDGVFMGNVLSAGLGQAPARQAGFKAGLGEQTPATTISKVCGSGMQAVVFAHDQISLERMKIVVAGGMESMTNAPYLLPKMRGGARLGHTAAIDHMFFDGLEDAYDQGRLMGSFAEDCATDYQFTRNAQDDYALASLQRALDAQKSGAFKNETVGITIKSRKGEIRVEADEQPAKASPEKIPTLKPAFQENGTVTAANASSISDGGAALILGDEAEAERLGVAVRARVLGYATHAQTPSHFPTAPIPAAKKLLDQLGWQASDVDLWEVNEAFALVPMAFMKELDIPHEKMNLHGGACALGHPIGASGARILVTLLNAMELHGLQRGIAAICIGGGEGLSVAIERS